MSMLDREEKKEGEERMTKFNTSSLTKKDVRVYGIIMRAKLQ